MKKILVYCLVMAMTVGASYAQDIKAGKKTFNTCRSCHSIKEGKHKIGPSLFNIVGRQSASSDFKKYSSAMKKADIVWTEENLRIYLHNPKKFIKGTRMTFRGLKKDKDLDNIIAYLKTLK